MAPASAPGRARRTQTSLDGQVVEPQHKAGDASWGGPAKQTEENLMDKPFEGIVVDFKY
jgi:hypothetical protein